MRVAMLAAPPVTLHGWGRYTRDLISGLAQIGVEVVLITSTDAPADPELPVAAYHRWLPSLVKPTRFTVARMLAAIPAIYAASLGCSAIHVVAEPYALATLPFRRIIVTAHGTYVPRTATRRMIGRVYRSIYRRATIVCVSRFTEKQVLAILPSARTVVIPNGVDAQRFEQSGTVPIKYGLTVLSVGQLKPRKGFHILAQAMRQVCDHIPDAQAIFIGDLSDRAYVDSIRAQLEHDHLTESVHLLGRVDDSTLYGWYHAADVFAMPSINIGSDFEGFGLVYLEANAAGLPAVGTLGCGAEDAIRDGETGYLIPQNDVTATAQTLIRLLSNPDLRARLGATGLAHARAHGWEQIAQRVLALYRN